MTTISLSQVLALNASRLGADVTALKHGDETISWGELDRRSTMRAWALKAAGVLQDDLVTIALPNGALFYEFTFALWKIGATPHVVSWRLPLRELAAIVEIAKPRLVLASTPELLDGLNGLDPSSLIESRDEPLPSVTARHWKAMSSGGSTGLPKIILDHKPAEVDLEQRFLGIPAGEIVVNPGPLFHNAPFTLTHHALFYGSAVVGMPKFDPEETLRLIAENRASWICLVPTMMHRIWQLPSEVRAAYDLSSLKTVWHLGSAMPVWLKEFWLDWLGPDRIWELYGGTEGMGGAVISGKEWLEHRGSVGKPVNCDIRILDERGSQLPPGEVGEIFMLPSGGPGTTYHYIGAEARLAGNGYESIGDFGWLDEDGYLYISDRRTDLIISGGANIYPAEVEAVLMEHQGIDDVVVIGLPHEDLGAAVHAIINPRPGCGAMLGDDELSEFLANRLVRYKQPKSYEITNEPLRDEAGKVRRSRLREERINT